MVKIKIILFSQYSVTLSDIATLEMNCTCEFEQLPRGGEQVAKPNKIRKNA